MNSANIFLQRRNNIRFSKFLPFFNVSEAVFNIRKKNNKHSTLKRDFFQHYQNLQIENFCYFQTFITLEVLFLTVLMHEKLKIIQNF